MEIEQLIRIMLETIIELHLVHPYSVSILRVIELVNTWGLRIVNMATYKEKATIGVPVQKFKKMFGENPRKKEYEVPENMKDFIQQVIVEEIVVKEK